MKNYISKKWKQLTKQQQEELLKSANIWDNIKDGSCIVDFCDNLSVKATIVDDEIIIDDNAILYDPHEGTIIENEKFKNLISLKDASIKFNKEESTLRKNIKNGFFKEWEDCIKFGKQWVFDIKALEKKYGEYEKITKDIEL